MLTTIVITAAGTAAAYRAVLAWANAGAAGTKRAKIAVILGGVGGGHGEE